MQLCTLWLDLGFALHMVSIQQEGKTNQTVLDLNKCGHIACIFVSLRGIREYSVWKTMLRCFRGSLAFVGPRHVPIVSLVKPPLDGDRPTFKK